MSSGGEFESEDEITNELNDISTEGKDPTEQVQLFQQDRQILKADIKTLKRRNKEQRKKRKDLEVNMFD